MPIVALFLGQLDDIAGEQAIITVTILAAGKVGQSRYIGIEECPDSAGQDSG